MINPAVYAIAAGAASNSSHYVSNQRLGLTLVCIVIWALWIGMCFWLADRFNMFAVVFVGIGVLLPMLITGLYFIYL